MVKPPQKPSTRKQLDIQSRDRSAELEALRAEIDIGIRELDAGLSEPLDVEDFLRRLNEEWTRSNKAGR